MLWQTVSNTGAGDRTVVCVMSRFIPVLEESEMSVWICRQLYNAWLLRGRGISWWSTGRFCRSLTNRETNRSDALVDRRLNGRRPRSISLTFSNQQTDIQWSPIWSVASAVRNRDGLLTAFIVQECRVRQSPDGATICATSDA